MRNVKISSSGSLFLLCNVLMFSINKIMNKKTIYALSLSTLLMAGFASCVSDDSSYADDSLITELSIMGLSEKMPVINVNLGERCTISPDIKYSADKSNLKYVWSVGDYTSGSKGTLEEVSTDTTLDYMFTKGGAYYVHLTVTDGSVGLVQEYQVNVNRTFENGYVLVSNDENNNGNLAFVKIMSAEEQAAGIPQVYLEHCLSLMNEGLDDGHLINVLTGTVTVNYPNTVTRLLVSTEDAVYFLDPNSFTVISEIDYKDAIPNFKASNFYPDYIYPCAYDASKKQFVHLDLTYMFSFEYSRYLGLTFDQLIKYPYNMWGGVYYNSYAITYPSTVALYDVNYGLYFPSPDGSFGDKKIITAFPGHTYNWDTWSYPNYILTQSTSDGKLYLCEASIDYYSSPMSTQIDKTTEIKTNGNPALPTQGMEVCCSSNYQRYYYYVDNAVYVLMLGGTSDTMPEKSEYAIKFPDNEKVTYLTTNDSDKELYVATYNSTTKRGSFYIYNLGDVKLDNQGSIKPKETHKNIADKITYLFKKSTL